MSSSLTGLILPKRTEGIAIKRLNQTTLFAALLLLLLGASACGGSGIGGNPTSRPTSRPTATFTPRSTELPLVPTSVLVGTSQKPIKIILVGETSAENSRAIRNLSRDFTEELDNFKLGYYDGLSVEFELVDDETEALVRICNSNDTIALVDAFTYVSAEKQCGAKPVLQSERDGETGSNFELVVFEQRIFNLQSLRGRPFCTINMNDLTSFVHPALAFEAAGIDPLDDFSDIITTYKTPAEVVIAITGRYEPGRVPACDAAALPVGTLDELEPQLVNEDAEQPLTQPQFNTVGVLQPAAGEEWSPIPYTMLIAPPDRLFPDFLLDEIVTAFENIEGDEGSAKTELQTLVPHDNFVEADASDYSNFRSWMARTGWNLAETVRVN